jgi:exonuclease III
LFLINAQGIASPNKLLIFKDHIKSLIRAPRIIVITEHWLNDKEVRGCNFLNYKHVSSFGRKDHLRGGSAILVERNVVSEVITVESTEMKFEVCSAVLTVGTEKILICAIYRPSNPENDSDMDFFFHKLESMVKKLLAVYKKRKFSRMLVCGDMNVNVLKRTSDSVRLKQIFDKFEFSLLNNVHSTRVVGKSSTLIDHIFAGPGPFEARSVVVPNLFSDHDGVLLSFHCNVPKPVDRFIWERRFTDINVKKFEVFLNRQSWMSVLQAMSVDAKYHAFLTTFLAGFEEFFPEVKKIQRANQLDKIVVSDTIRLMRAELRGLQILSRAPDLVMRENLKKQLKDKKYKYLSQLSLEIKNSNSRFIAEAQNKSKAAWGILQKSINVNAKGQEFVKELNVDGKVLTNVKEMADAFNLSFVMPEPTYSVPYHCVGPSTNNNLFLVPVGAHEVQCYLHEMPSKKAAGYDEIPMFLVKRLAQLVSWPLADIINCSFSEGVYPQDMKAALITPLFKKGERVNTKNYRPISVLPTFSKPFERCFLVRVVNFFQVNGLLPASQHGFLKGRCTDTALFEFFVSLYKSMEHKSKVLGIFYDLTNAFGSVCVPLILQKFEYLGVRGVPLKWLESALTGRSQKVKLLEILGKEVHQVYSEELSFSRGTPQGGIISPFIFDVGIFDMALFVLLGVLINYADDSTSLIAARTVNLLFENSRLSAESMFDFCKANFLQLNSSKSVILHFHNPTGPHSDFTPYVPISGKSVPCLPTTKLLGLFISDNFSWQSHADYVIGKLNSGVFLTSNLLKTVHLPHLKMVYYAYAYSIMQYGIVFWGASESALDEVFVAQKRLVRCLAGERYWPGLEPLCSCRPLFARLDLLPVFSIYLLECCKFARRHPHYFRRTADVHSYGTRKKPELFIDCATSLSISKMNPAVCVPKFYNALPEEIRAVQGCGKFIRALKKFVYANKFYSAEEFYDAVKI